MKNTLHTITTVTMWSGVITLILALYLNAKDRSEKIDSLNLKVHALQYSIDSLENQINEYHESIMDMSDELQWKEEEISYWGQKYDSTKLELQKYNKTK